MPGAIFVLVPCLCAGEAADRGSNVSQTHLKSGVRLRPVRAAMAEKRSDLRHLGLSAASLP